MIKNAARIKFQALKLDTDPKSTRLTFMYFIEDLSNLLDMFHQTSNILAKYPEVTYPSEKYLYAKKSLFTLINSYSNSEVKRIIKDTYGDGCKALKLLQSRCARTTPEDTIRVEHLFNTMHIQQTENATRYIKRFRNAKLLAKSVGVEIQGPNLIDKFLMSMAHDRRYRHIVQYFQTQRRHENLTPNYSLAKLTITEIESHLYAIDENSKIQRNMANQTRSFNKNNHCRSNDKFKKRSQTQKRDMSTIICYNCDEKGHIAPNCPHPKKSQSTNPSSLHNEKLNTASSKNIVLSATKNDNVHVNMAISNVGRKKHFFYQTFQSCMIFIIGSWITFRR